MASRIADFQFSTFNFIHLVINSTPSVFISIRGSAHICYKPKKITQLPVFVISSLTYFVRYGSIFALKLSSVYSLSRMQELTSCFLAKTLEDTVVVVTGTFSSSPNRLSHQQRLQSRYYSNRIFPHPFTFFAGSISCLIVSILCVLSLASNNFALARRRWLQRDNGRGILLGR